MKMKRLKKSLNFGVQTKKCFYLSLPKGLRTENVKLFDFKLNVSLYVWNNLENR